MCVAHEHCKLEMTSDIDSFSITQLTFSNWQSNKFNGRSLAKQY